MNLNEALLHLVAALQQDYIIGTQDNIVTQVQFMFLNGSKYILTDALYMELHVLISFMTSFYFFNMVARLRDGMSKGRM